VCYEHGRELLEKEEKDRSAVMIKGRLFAKGEEKYQASEKNGQGLSSKGARSKGNKVSQGQRSDAV